MSAASVGPVETLTPATARALLEHPIFGAPAHIAARDILLLAEELEGMRLNRLSRREVDEMRAEQIKLQLEMCRWSQWEWE